MLMNKNKLLSMIDRICDQPPPTKDSKVLIIDGMNMFIRAFSANPSVNSNGQHIGGIIGFLKSVVHCIDKFSPTRCIIVFDGDDGGREKRKIHPDYKSGRKNKIRTNRFLNVDAATTDPEQSFKWQFEQIEKYLACIPVTTMVMNHVEADDIIGCLVNDYYKDIDNQIYIVSADKDFLQLVVNDGVYVYRPITKVLYDRNTIKQEYGLLPENFIFYRVIDGDKSDNIPGVKGVGLKTLLKIVPAISEREYGIDELISECQKQIDNGDGKKVLRSVVESKELMERNYMLMRLDEVVMPSIKTLQIRDWVEQEIPTFDFSTFWNSYKSDGLHDYNMNFGYKAVRQFEKLNQYAKDVS